MQNNPINGDAGINNPNLPSNIDADQEDKNIKHDPDREHKEEESVPEDFDKFNVDKVEELEESKDSSNKES